MEFITSGHAQNEPATTRDFEILMEELETGGETNPISSHSVLERVRRLRNETHNLHSQVIDRLERLGIPAHIILAALSRSKRTGAPLTHELASSDQLDLHAYYRLLASDLGLPFETSVNPKRMMVEVSATHFRPGRTIQVCCRDESGGLILYMAPDLRSENQLLLMFKKNPKMRSRFSICDPQTILSAVEARLALRDVDTAITKLHRTWPHLSAKDTLVPWQAFVFGILAVLLPLSVGIWFWETLFVLHVLAIILFAGSVAIRVAAWRALDTEVPKELKIGLQANYPVYSVMVALHKEAAVVPQLVRSMARLDWPKSRLEVFYVCEADDMETISALSKIRLPTSHRIIFVPAADPRTKPKALNFALERCTGDFVVIYDAEDRPNPGQLKEAWSRFCNEPEEMACLQSPLDISNAQQSWLSQLFAFEYAAHFHGLLPYLGKIGAPLPLGGTSNHFRKSVLVEALGWDPFNVTEDADLGIRLYRLGYKCGVLKLPTLEDAPTKINQWLPQRTRWIKGWMQTYIVHNRDYKNLKKKIGTNNNRIFQILMINFIISPIIYLISIVQIVFFMLNSSENGIFAQIIIYIDLAIFIMGHIGYGLLALACWRRVNGKSPIFIALTLPAYWALASVASWRAVWKLITSPHEWEKTPHQIAFIGKPKSKI